jgi:regulator of RNase E activity RraA
MVDLNMLSGRLYTAVVSDAMDSLGYRNQAVTGGFTACTGQKKLVGRAKTTLWADIFNEDKQPYELELRAVDSCKPGEVIICAAGGSLRSGIWGELLSNAARNAGCSGVIVHGAIRDIMKMTEMAFPVFASAQSPLDSRHRQKVIDLDVPVEINGLLIKPGDIVFADEDGIVVIPQEIEEEVIRLALEKVTAENVTRNAIKNGMKATDVYLKYGVL